MYLDAELAAGIFEQVNDGLYFVDPERRITYWNKAAERISGYSREQMIGQFCHFNLLMHVNEQGEQLCLGACPLAETLRDGQKREAVVYLHHADGHRVSVGVRVLPVVQAGEIIGAVEIFTENATLSTAMARIEALQEAVMRDALTGIGSRRMAQMRLEIAWKEWRRRGLHFGVIMIDVDHFKRVNDRLGHALGDRVLQMVTNSLSGGLRGHEFIGRWGGEEFVAVIGSEDGQSLAGAAERLRMLVESSLIFLDPHDRQLENAVRVTVSLGAALVHPSDSLKSLLARADQALYRAKAGGRNRVEVDLPGTAVDNNPCGGPVETV